MELLRDTDLIRIVESGQTIRGVPDTADWDAKDSPVQPSSVDLHIGGVLLPGKKKGQLGGESRHMKQHLLRPGRTAVIVTQETLNLPLNMAAIAFPPSHVSERGLLMTNPGHVDPGYEGPMRFTVINMAKEPYRVSEGQDIVTLLFFKLSDSVRTGWRERHGGEASAPPTQEDTERLCRDFMDIDKRAKQIARNTVLKWGGILAVFVALFSVVPSLWISLRQPPAWVKSLEEIQTKVARVEERQHVADIWSALEAVEGRVDTLEASEAAGGGTSGTTNASIDGERSSQIGQEDL